MASWLFGYLVGWLVVLTVRCLFSWLVGQLNVSIV